MGRATKAMAKVASDCSVAAVGSPCGKKTGELIGMVAQQVGGKGGGRPDMAQAGGTDAAALPAALASVKGWVSAKLQ